MNDWRPFADEETGLPVRGFLHGSLDHPGDWLVLTHGAGSNCQSALLVSLGEAFAEAGVNVLRCDLAFRQQRPQGPPPRGSAERDQQGLRAAVAAVRKHTAGRIFLGGHSYGGRMASILAAEAPALAAGLLLLAYPLHPPRRPDQWRTGHFPQLQAPALFVHGTRDAFGSIAELTAALQLIPAPVELLAMEGAGHELLATSKAKEQARQIVTCFRSASKQTSW